MGMREIPSGWDVRWIAPLALLVAGCTFDTSGLPGNQGGGAGSPDATVGGGGGGGGGGGTPDAGPRPTSPDARTTTQPDARPADPAAWQNILRNSNFEAADQHWVEQNSFGYQIIADDETYGPAYNGDWAAWFGGIDDEHATLSQGVFLPPGTTELRVRGWIYISTEISGDDDKLEFRLEPAGPSSNATVQILKLFHGTDAGPTGVSGWQSFEGHLGAIQGGEPARFVVKSDTDGHDSAMFVIDDLVLEALAPTN